MFFNRLIQGFCSKKILCLFISLICLYLFSSKIFRSKVFSIGHLPKHLSHRDHYPKEAFVIFTNQQKQYVALLDVLLDSIHLFSSRSVIVFTVDFDLMINRTRHSRLFTERIAQNDCGPNIYACKIYAMIASEVQYGVQIDVDSVVNYHVDLLFEMLHQWPHEFPLAPKHPGDPKDYKYDMKEHHVQYASTPYMHGAFLWTFRSYRFLLLVLTSMQRVSFQNAQLDETAMNVMLWKAKTKYVLCKYDPYGPIYIDKYEKSEKNPECLPHCDGIYLVFHGQKESSVSEQIFRRLQTLGSTRPFVQTPHGLKFFNDTNVTCCHPSATRTSNIHRLICEYENYRIQ